MKAPSLPQLAFSAISVLEHEADIANYLGIEMFDLMSRAGEAVFAAIQSRYAVNGLLIVVGKGNNAGDGYIVGTRALAKGICVRIVSFTEPEKLEGDAAKAAQAYMAMRGEVIHYADDSFLTAGKLEGINLIVDAVFGIGFHGQLREPYVALFDRLTQLGLPIVSIDVPSGVNATTGQVAQGAICANHTVSFIALKQGLLTGAARHYCGELIFEGLTLAQAFCQRVPPQAYLQTQDNLPSLLPRKAHQHKGNIGLLVTIGGNAQMPGAIRLASEAALRCGAPLVSVCCHTTSQAMVINQRYELMLGDTNAAALQKSNKLKDAKGVVIGPGLGRDNWAEAFFEQAILFEGLKVIDADALNLLAQKYPTGTPLKSAVLTPHPKEAGRLLGKSVKDIEADRFEAVAALAKKYHCICVLKGAGTLVSDGQFTFINQSGNAGMATGGMGDVLSGMIGALMLQTHDLFEATRLAVYLHGKAGDNIVLAQGSIGLLASDLFPQLPPLLQNIYEPN